MRFGRLAPLVLVIAGWSILPACSWFSHSSSGPLIADVRSPIADVPVPAGFSMTGDSTSKVDFASGLRIVNHFYKGSDDYLLVVQFYRDQMPSKGWALADQSQAAGKEITVHYTKGNEDCRVTIKSGTLDTHIHVRLEPRSALK